MQVDYKDTVEKCQGVSIFFRHLLPERTPFATAISKLFFFLTYAFYFSWSWKHFLFVLASRILSSLVECLDQATQTDTPLVLFKEPIKSYSTSHLGVIDFVVLSNSDILEDPSRPG